MNFKYYMKNLNEFINEQLVHTKMINEHFLTLTKK